MHVIFPINVTLISTKCTKIRRTVLFLHGTLTSFAQHMVGMFLSDFKCKLFFLVLPLRQQLVLVVCFYRVFTLTFKLTARSLANFYRQ